MLPLEHKMAKCAKSCLNFSKFSKGIGWWFEKNSFFANLKFNSFQWQRWYHLKFRCIGFMLGAIHKWRHPLRGDGGTAKRWCSSISLFSKMGDKGKGGCSKVSKNGWRHLWMAPYFLMCLKYLFRELAFSYKVKWLCIIIKNQQIYILKIKVTSPDFGT